jgi:hypothetical protein
MRDVRRAGVFGRRISSVDAVVSSYRNCRQ